MPRFANPGPPDGMIYAGISPDTNKPMYVINSIWLDSAAVHVL
jgi:hypothetical protein